MGSSPRQPDPFSPEAVAFRKEELEMQQRMAREEQAFQRAQSQEDREWQEDLESRKALRKQKEEEERIRALREEQGEALDEASEMMAQMADDPDQFYSNMWSSLASGMGSSDRQAYSSGGRRGKKRSSSVIANAFSDFLSNIGS